MIKNRKLEHIEFCLSSNAESPTTMLEEIELIHQAIPNANLDDIQLEASFLGKHLKAPLLVASMTGGHEDTAIINRNLAEAVNELGLGMGVGSQRAAILDPSLAETYSIVRRYAPGAFIFANIGAPQILEYGAPVAHKVVDMIEADALAIHLNYLQEAIQPEGDTFIMGLLDEIAGIARNLPVPVIVKETGAGINRCLARALRDAGVAAIDVGGRGGTTWSGVETARARRQDDKLRVRLGELYHSWGIPTAQAIFECRKLGIPLIATGGLRTGLDVLKTLVIGADTASIGLPFLRAALKGTAQVIKLATRIIEELRVGLFLTGCRNISDAESVEYTVGEPLFNILSQRGLIEG